MLFVNKNNDNCNTPIPYIYTIRILKSTILLSK